MRVKTPRRIRQLQVAAEERQAVIPLHELMEIERRIGVSFRDKTLLQRAFIHRSYGTEAELHGLDDNQRLEFLGDGIMLSVVNEFLYRELPEFDEGQLTSVKGAITSNETIADVVLHMDLEGFVRMSRGQRSSLQSDRRKIQARGIRADVFEAIVGAIYLDRGLGTVELFLNEFLFPRLQDILVRGLHFDAKSRLQELAQSGPKVTPTYSVLDEHGPDHAKKFLVGVYLGERLIGKGWGASKYEGQREAAQDGLKNEFQVEMDH